jgi:hypothetical protein
MVISRYSFSSGVSEVVLEFFPQFLFVLGFGVWCTCRPLIFFGDKTVVRDHTTEHRGRYRALETFVDKFVYWLKFSWK